MKRKSRQPSGASSTGAAKQQRTDKVPRRRTRSQTFDKKQSQLHDQTLTLAISEGELLAEVLRDMSSAFKPFEEIFTPTSWFLDSIRPFGKSSTAQSASTLPLKRSPHEVDPSFNAAIASFELAFQCMRASGDALSSLSAQPSGLDLIPAPKPPVRKRQTKKKAQDFLEPDNVASSEQVRVTTSPSKPLKKSSKVSNFFDPFAIEPTPPGLSFRLAPSEFGLIQERIRNDLWALVVQTVLWNQTTAKAGRPVLFKLLSDYPTPELTAEANYEDILAIIGRLGLQNKRSQLLIKLAQAWLRAPPDPTRRYAKKNYPNPGDNWNLADGTLLDDDDLRPGFEIAHLPGVGPYAIDSYRIFYRDTLRAVRSGDDEVIEPEWKRVWPGDKDLRAYLAWKWQQEGWNWNKVTGQRTRITDLNE